MLFTEKSKEAGEKKNTSTQNPWGFRAKHVAVIPQEIEPASDKKKERKEVGSICAFLGARIMQAKSEAGRGLKAINETRLPLNC